MPQSVRSILGKSSKVRKSYPSSPAARKPSPRKPTKARVKDEDETLFAEQLDDHGVVQLMREELTLRDVVQAMRYIRSTMFTPLPETGLHSTRVSEILNYRASLPPVVTLGHLDAVLRSPTRTEREMVELITKGVLRKVRVERRGGVGEALIESPDLEVMVRRSSLAAQTAEKFLLCLAANRTAQALPQGGLDISQADELLRAGFLTSSLRATPGTTLHVRPEDRTTLTSVDRVSRCASGTVSAVGGANAIHLAGGSGAGRQQDFEEAAEPAHLRVAVPGHGRYLKLASGAIDWLQETLGRTRWGECPESWLKERFEGGGLYGARWKTFWGVQWEWVLGQAVGLGVVELFDTGSVGRGVRALGG